MRSAVLLFLIALCCTASSAVAQGFMVKPLRLDAMPRPGQDYALSLQIWNTAVDGPRDIDLRIVDISQDTAGNLTVFENGEQPPASHASAAGWVTIDGDRVSIPAQEPVSIGISVRPPADARGTYVAGIIAETPIPEGTNGVVVRTRFLIPVLIQIQGRAARQKVEISALGMERIEGDDASTKAALTINNSGFTYARVRGVLSVERQDGERWRPVTKVELPEQGILPGLQIALANDLERKLPSGSYRLRGELYVDGRRVAPLETVLDFVGDPSASTAYDAALLLEPALAEVTVVPGATRTTVIRVENTTDDAVDIELMSETPQSLASVEYGSLRGAALSAEPFTTIQPAAFRLRARAAQNVRVVTALPKEGVEYPFYYADLTIKGSYADGQSAGETHSTIRIANNAVAAVIDGQVEQVSIALADKPSTLVAQLRFSNTGTTDVTARSTVQIATLQGRSLRNVKLDGEVGSLLPLNKRVFSGEIDIGGLEPGEYLLTAAVEADDQTFARRFSLEITEEELTSSNGSVVRIPSASLKEIAPQ